MRGLLLLCLVGCATAAPPPPAGPDDAERAYRADYDEAVRRAVAGDLAGAAAILDRRGAALEAGGHDDVAALVWNTTTWVRWAEGDLDGALADNARMGRSVDRVADAETAAGLRLHVVWDRAYLLRDRADRVAAAERPAALAAAEATRAEYDRLAPPDAADGVAVLDCYFAWRAGDVAAATAAARKVDLENDRDAQDLYIVALALEAAGDGATAERLRARIAEAKYMMPPLLARWARTSSAR